MMIISMWIQKGVYEDSRVDAFGNYDPEDEFELYDIEDEVIQLEDYIKAKYDVNVEYIPETKFDMKFYYDLKDIPDNLDIVSFYIYFKIKK